MVRLIKTLQQALKMDREKFKVPRSVQQAIPVQRIWPDGVFQSGTKFSKSFRFSDINYAIASKEDKTEMFLDYSELLNALDSGASAKITLNNRRINKEEFEASLLLPMKEDGLDEYRSRRICGKTPGGHFDCSCRAASLYYDFRRAVLLRGYVFGLDKRGTWHVLHVRGQRPCGNGTELHRYGKCPAK